MLEFIAVIAAFFTLSILLVWALVLIVDRIKEIRHVCWSDETFCGECIDERQRMENAK